VRSVKTIKCNVKEIQTGDVFGGEELFDEMHRFTSIKALCDCEVLYINKAKFLQGNL
jgi:CRP-like cAMP-binding protein